MPPAPAQGPLWVPDPVRVTNSRLARFRAQQSIRAGSAAADAVHAWSIDHPDEFWSEVARAAISAGTLGKGPALVASDAPPGVSFFPDARVCFAEELLAGAQRPGASSTAIVYRREDGWRETYSWVQLHDAVQRMAQTLMAHGVRDGDRVAGWLPNCPEAVITMLATNLIGAVYTSASPDFGPRALADRFAQVEPKTLVVADGYLFAGRQHRRIDLLPEVLEHLRSVTQVLVVPELTRQDEPAAREMLEYLPAVPATVDMRVFPRVGVGAPSDSVDIDPLRVAYDHAAFILYSSGTTGRPKCLVHSGLGLLLKHWTEHALHCDVHPGDVVFFYTTTGWMMWNWLVSALAVGATIVLYDGSPVSPSPAGLWQMAAQEQVTFFGAGAKYYEACRSAGLQLSQDYPNPSLRTVASTGSPLAPADFEYLYEQWGDAIHLASISGGTDICGCFVLGDPTAPVYSGEIQTPALGVDIDVLDADGASLRVHPGQRGDLVCRNALPSMPLRFWGDDDASSYRRAYFEGFPGVWTHGDFAEWTVHGGIVITGRSDATLNVGGVRIGTAEIYRQLAGFPIVDAIAVAQDNASASRIVLFVQMSPGSDLTDELRGAIRSRLRSHASPRHVPGLIIEVPDLPRTRSGKLAELVVADIVNDRPIRVASGLANPDSLEWLITHAEDFGATTR